MDLTAWLRHRAVPRPLLVAVPGATPVRWAVERALRERGWTAATSAAEADLLVVCGEADDALQEAVERVWDALPSPRARVDVPSGNEVGLALDGGRARLEDRAWQGDDAVARDTSVGPGGGAHHGHDVPGGGHDMHMMHGGDVAGLAMADRAADRDGLALDQVHLTLGPVLPDWPAGLVVRLVVQGDVVQSAEVEVVGDAAPRVGPVAEPPVVALDDLAALLSVCGWDVAARTARRLRDEHLADTVDAVELARFVRRLRRSRALRWATDGLGELVGPGHRGDAATVDATGRWLWWLDVVEGGAPGATVPGAGPPPAALPELLVGRELAAVRVVVASFGADLHDPAPTPSTGTIS